MHLFRSCVQSIAPIIAERMSYSGAGDHETPGRNILVVGGRRHVEKSSGEFVEWLVVVVSSE